MFIVYFAHTVNATAVLQYVTKFGDQQRTSKSTPIRAGPRSKISRFRTDDFSSTFPIAIPYQAEPFWSPAYPGPFRAVLDPPEPQTHQGP